MLDRDQTKDIKIGIASLSTDMEYISGRLLQGELLDRHPSSLFCKYSPLVVRAPVIYMLSLNLPLTENYIVLQKISSCSLYSNDMALTVLNSFTEQKMEPFLREFL